VSFQGNIYLSIYPSCVSAINLSIDCSFINLNCLFISMSVCLSFYLCIGLLFYQLYYLFIVLLCLSIVPSIHHLYKIFLYLFLINKLLTILASFLFFLVSPQRVCQRKRACGEQERVPQAQTSAADRERTQWISGMDLQSRSVHKQMYRYKFMS